MDDYTERIEIRKSKKQVLKAAETKSPLERIGRRANNSICKAELAS